MDNEWQISVFGSSLAVVCGRESVVVFRLLVLSPKIFFLKRLVEDLHRSNLWNPCRRIVFLNLPATFKKKKPAKCVSDSHVFRSVPYKNKFDAHILLWRRISSCFNIKYCNNFFNFCFVYSFKNLKLLLELVSWYPEL